MQLSNIFRSITEGGAAFQPVQPFDGPEDTPFQRFVREQHQRRARRDAGPTLMDVFTPQATTSAPKIKPAFGLTVEQASDLNKTLQADRAQSANEQLAQRQLAISQQNADSASQQAELSQLGYQLRLQQMMQPEAETFTTQKLGNKLVQVGSRGSYREIAEAPAAPDYQTITTADGRLVRYDANNPNPTLQQVFQDPAKQMMYAAQLAKAKRGPAGPAPKRPATQIIDGTLYERDDATGQWYPAQGIPQGGGGMDMKALLDLVAPGAVQSQIDAHENRYGAQLYSLVESKVPQENMASMGLVSIIPTETGPQVIPNPAALEAFALEMAQTDPEAAALMEQWGEERANAVAVSTLDLATRLGKVLNPEAYPQQEPAPVAPAPPDLTDFTPQGPSVPTMRTPGGEEVEIQFEDDDAPLPDGSTWWVGNRTTEDPYAAFTPAAIAAQNAINAAANAPYVPIKNPLYSR